MNVMTQELMHDTEFGELIYSHCNQSASDSGCVGYMHYVPLRIYYVPAGALSDDAEV